MFKLGCRVCDAMTKKPIAVSPESTIRQCALLMREKGVGGLVVKEGDILKGYLTEEAIIAKVVAADVLPSKVKAKDVMNVKVVTINPDQDIHEAMILMKKNKVRKLPVVDRETEKLVGLITINDILKLEPQLLEMMSDKANTDSDRKAGMTLEGSCELCGCYSYRLHSTEEGFLCSGCTPQVLKKAQRYK